MPVAFSGASTCSMPIELPTLLFEMRRRKSSGTIESTEMRCAIQNAHALVALMVDECYLKQLTLWRVNDPE